MFGKPILTAEDKMMLSYLAAGLNGTLLAGVYNYMGAVTLDTWMTRETNPWWFAQESNEKENGSIQYLNSNKASQILNTPVLKQAFSITSNDSELLMILDSAIILYLFLHY